MADVASLGLDSGSTDLAKMTDDLEKQELPTLPEAESITSAQPAIRNRSTAYLDGLRGLAALMVYMSHHIPWFYGFDWADDSLERAYGDGSKDFAKLPFVRIFFTGGSAAVSIFFVLSGYVLSRGPLSLLREGQTKACYTGLVSSTLRRPLRLFLPAAGVSLAFAFVMQLPFGLAPHLTWPEPKENIFLQVWNWVDEFSRVINPFDSHGIEVRWFPYDPPLWTIAIEFRGSIIVFALIAAYSRVSSSIRLALFSVTGLVFLYAYEWSIFCFMAGVVLAINDQEGFDSWLLKRHSKRIHTLVYATIFVLGWWLICQPARKREPEQAMKAWGWHYVTMFVPGKYWREEYWRFWHSWGSVLLVFGVLRLRMIQQFFGSKYLRYLGRVSFSLYLTHIPFLWTVGDRIYRSFGTARMDFTTVFDDRLYIPDLGPRGLSTRFLISQAFILSLNLGLSEIATSWLDEPSVRAGKWLAGKVISNAPRVPASPPTLKELKVDT